MIRKFKTSVPSFIKPYTDELDGLYFGINPKGAKPCIAVWKGEL